MLRTILSGAGGLALLVVGLQLSSACYDVADTNYGNANGLAVANIPGEAGVTATCDTAGLRFDSGSCPSFANDVFPYFQGNWACVSGGCHGGPTQPKMDPQNAGTTLAALRATTVGGKSYVPAAGTGTSDQATKTSLLCNLQGSCGVKMPKAPGATLTSAEQCLITAWVNCGAPP